MPPLIVRLIEMHNAASAQPSFNQTGDLQISHLIFVFASAEPMKGRCNAF
jgi:hypothetical protein